MTGRPSHPFTYPLALWLTPGVGPRRFYTIINHFPDLSVLFESPLKTLIGFGIPEKIAQALQVPHWDSVKATLNWSDLPDCHLISHQCEAYPILLKEIDPPPPFLFIKGNVQALNSKQIAMVGSRKPTPSGLNNAQTFAQALSKSGFTITSGLALGIDTACHHSTIKVDGITIAVLGTSIDRVYPYRNRKLSTQIIEHNGALVSDFPLNTPPKPENFPRRNRIISGLSLGTLVVEATAKSGSLITAKHANEQGRDVFAIPGSINNAQSKGCHLLIQEGAKLTQSPGDILEELSIYPSNSPAPKEAINEKGQNFLDAHSQLLLECVGYEQTTVDDLLNHINLPANIVISTLSALELRGLVVATPRGYYKV